MPAELRDLLDDAAGAPDALPDFEALAAAGLRRRRRARVVQASTTLAVLVAIGVVGASVLGPLRPAPVLLDSPPRPGLGAWEAVPEAPIEPASGADAVDLGDGTVLVVGGRVVEPRSGERGTAQAARYDVATRAWTVLPDVPLQLDTDTTQNAGALRSVPADDDTVAVWRDWTSAPVPAFEAAVLDGARAGWMATGPAPLSPRVDPVVAWVEERLLVWGGTVPEVPHDLGEAPTIEEAMGPGDVREPAPGGAVWSASTGWVAMPDGPLVARIDAATLVDAGRLIVWGGATGGIEHPDRELLADGAVYDVAAARWTPLPDTELSGRTNAAVVADGDGLAVAGGVGQVTVTVDREPERTCRPDEGNCDRTSSMSRRYDYDERTDGARYADGAWTPLPPLPAEVDGVTRTEHPIAGAVLEAIGPAVTWRLEDGAWVEVPQHALPQDSGEWLREHALLDGRIAGVWSASMGSPPGRLTGAVHDGERWAAMAEADTPARIDPAVTVLAGKAVFVWGGTSRVADEPLDSPEAFASHRDGAIWRP